MWATLVGVSVGEEEKSVNFAVHESLINCKESEWPEEEELKRMRLAVSWRRLTKSIFGAKVKQMDGL